MRTMTIAVVTLVAALSAWATETEFDGATRTNDWFDVSMSNVVVGTTITINSNIGITKGQGSWTAVPTDVTATTATEDSVCFIALFAQDESLTFTPAPFAVTSGYETVVATIKSDAGDELPEVPESAQAAFTAIVTNGTLTAFGLTANGWTNLVYNSVEALTNDWFTIYMDFANGENATRKVRYSVQPSGGARAVLGDGTETWFPTDYRPTITNISFSGVGKVQQFSGDELAVPITFDTINVDFLADYHTATTVVANVSGTVAADTTFTLSALGENYIGDYDNGQVKFYNVTLTNEFALGSKVGYQLSAGSGNTYTGTTGSIPQSTTIGNQTANWILEDSEHDGSGTWTDSSVVTQTLDYSSESPYAAALSDYLFTPTNAVGDAVVTVVSTVCFGDVADTSVNPGDDSYAAFRIGDDSGTPTFQVWVKERKNSEPEWVNVSGVAPSAESVYTLTSKFDFIEGRCEFLIDGTQLVNGETSKFYLANNIRTMKAIKFNGTGSLVSLTGSYLATEQIAPAVDGTNVTVSSKWVAEHLPSGTTIEQAQAMLNPESDVKTTHGNSEYNYFECYALGIDPEDNAQAPEISNPTVEENGKISFSLDGVDEVPVGVTLTVNMKSYSTPDGAADDSAAGVEGSMTIVGGGKTTNNLKVDPSKVDSVKYYKFDISIGATP